MKWRRTMSSDGLREDGMDETRAGGELLDRMFAAYRDALGEFRPSPQFLPLLWAKIESRNPVSWLTHLAAWSPRLALTALVFAALLIASLALPYGRSNGSAVLEASYVDVLTLDSMDEYDRALWQLAENKR